MPYQADLKKQKESSQKLVEESIKKDHEDCLRGFIREFKKYDNYVILGEKAAWLLRALEKVDHVK